MNGQIVEMVPAGAMPLFSHATLWEIYRWGIEVIRVIQKIENPILTTLVKFITALGTANFYLPVILFIFWWIDEKRGIRLGILIMVSAWINSLVKDLLAQPRPYNLEPSIGLAAESSYGAPSGHAQMSLTFWVPMALWLGEKPGRKRWLIWTTVILFILLIGFTRLYLGVHFPTDLFLGWVIAGIVLVLWFVPGRIIEKSFAAAGRRIQNISAAIIVLVMNGMYPKDRTLPALLLGFVVGYSLMRKYFPFSARGEINGKKPGIPVMIFRCLTGFLGMAVIFLALRLMLPGEGSLFKDLPVWGAASPFYELGRFIHYGCLGLWVAAGAPRIFQRMGLAPDTSGQGEKGNDSGAD